MSKFTDVYAELKAKAGSPLEGSTAEERSAARRADEAFEALKPRGSLSRQRLSVDLPAELVTSFRDLCQRHNFAQREALQAAVTAFVNHFA